MDSKKHKQPQRVSRTRKNAGRDTPCGGIEVIDLGEAEVIVYDDFAVPTHFLEVRQRHRIETCI